MGLMDKLSKAAKTAKKVKDALDSAGVLGDDDAAKARPASAKAASPTAAGGRSPGYRAIVQCCVTDPFDLIDVAEVAELTGLALGPPEEWHSDDCVGVEVRESGSGHFVRVDSFPTKADAKRPADAATTWRFVSTDTPEPHAPIAGLGDDAFCSNDCLVCVRVREQVLVVSGDLPTGTDVAAVLTAVARTAASRA